MVVQKKILKNCRRCVMKQSVARHNLHKLAKDMSGVLVYNHISCGVLPPQKNEGKVGPLEGLRLVRTFRVRIMLSNQHSGKRRKLGV